MLYYIQEFILDQQSRGNSPETIKYYGSCLDHFYRYCGDDFDLKNLTPRFLKQYVVYLSSSELSSVSVQSYCRGLRSFLSWLYNENYMFRRLRVRSGVHRLYPHLLRHTFATRFLENGGNIYTLQAILGHSSLEMVKKYLHLASSRIRADFPKFSPLDNIKKDPL